MAYLHIFNYSKEFSMKRMSFVFINVILFFVWGVSFTCFAKDGDDAKSEERIDSLVKSIDVENITKIVWASESFTENEKKLLVLELKYIVENKCYVVYADLPDDILYLKIYGSSISIEDAHGREARIYVTDSVRDVFLSPSLEKGIFYKLIHPERFPTFHKKLHELRSVTP